MSGETEFDRLLVSAKGGDESAASALFPLVYDELRTTARRLLGQQGRRHTLQPTALVHDAYMKLSRNRSEWENRRHFLCVAAKAMRQILADHADRRKTQKRGGGWHRITLNGELVADPAASGVDLVALDTALRELAEADPRGACVVELRFFSGMTIEEVAESIDASPTTVKEDWRAARSWLRWRLS
ncbi:MAG: sigma-70 family RNA polymerase sigma factor [Planctomycetota bacterium]|jgi:RNA polymerase sigma factor (TIGR02999 family)